MNSGRFVPLTLLVKGVADLSAVTEDGNAAGHVGEIRQIHLANCACEIAGCSRELPCPSRKVHWVSENCEKTVGDWHSSGSSGVKEQNISTLGNPMVLHVEDDSIPGPGLGCSEKSSADGAAEVTRGGP